MNWTGKDMDTYLSQKEYIDTLVIPLVKIELKLDNMKASASSAEFIMHLSSLIETQFKGRMMFVPPFSYSSATDLPSMAKTTLLEFSDTPFKHVFFLTTDHAWSTLKLPGQVIWMPSIPLESMEASLRQSILEDQLRQVLPKFIEKWSV
ncbi:DUF2487 family protein [Sporosarcina thermotolerans]|uniref:DUF2487 family protein n=1 Tax=Sporosarcina thermotolerans TaxID=633404 RepID=A0AAW9A601_9BACL|nr:DUF2487 family protein [Sporosarcina thermotolerans]MDW0115549.1 DUF2487 family protein [Sporosarcina thermotolerans]WHT47144.1 DUF2487 family protein [Sporosarcina thermotolerans]